MKLRRSSPPWFIDTSVTDRNASNELLLVALALMLAAGLLGCKQSQPAVVDSSKVTDPPHSERVEPSNAVTDLRSQTADLSKQLDNLRIQTADLGAQNSDLRAQNVQLREALGAALDAQERLAGQVQTISKDLRSARDDLSLVRQQLHDLELERESRPIGSSSSGITAQKPQ